MLSQVQDIYSDVEKVITSWENLQLRQTTKIIKVSNIIKLDSVRKALQRVLKNKAQDHTLLIQNFLQNWTPILQDLIKLSWIKKNFKNEELVFEILTTQYFLRYDFYCMIEMGATYLTIDDLSTNNLKILRDNIKGKNDKIINFFFSAIDDIKERSFLDKKDRVKYSIEIYFATRDKFTNLFDLRLDKISKKEKTKVKSLIKYFLLNINESYKTAIESMALMKDDELKEKYAQPINIATDGSFYSLINFFEENKKFFEEKENIKDEFQLSALELGFFHEILSLSIQDIKEIDGIKKQSKDGDLEALINVVNLYIAESVGAALGSQSRINLFQIIIYFCRKKIPESFEFQCQYDLTSYVESKLILFLKEKSKDYNVIKFKIKFLLLLSLCSEENLKEIVSIYECFLAQDSLDDFIYYTSKINPNLGVWESYWALKGFNEVSEKVYIDIFDGLFDKTISIEFFSKRKELIIALFSSLDTNSIINYLRYVLGAYDKSREGIVYLFLILSKEKNFDINQVDKIAEIIRQDWSILKKLLNKAQDEKIILDRLFINKTLKKDIIKELLVEALSKESQLYLNYIKSQLILEEHDYETLIDKVPSVNVIRFFNSYTLDWGRIKIDGVNILYKIEDVTLFQEMLNGIVSLDLIDSSGSTLLQFYLKEKRFEVAKLLLDILVERNRMDLLLLKNSDERTAFDIYFERLELNPTYLLDEVLATTLLINCGFNINNMISLFKEESIGNSDKNFEIYRLLLEHLINSNECSQTNENKKYIQQSLLSFIFAIYRFKENLYYKLFESEKFKSLLSNSDNIDYISVVLRHSLSLAQSYNELISLKELLALFRSNKEIISKLLSGNFIKNPAFHLLIDVLKSKTNINLLRLIFDNFTYDQLTTILSRLNENREILKLALNLADEEGSMLQNSTKEILSRKKENKNIENLTREIRNIGLDSSDIEYNNKRAFLMVVNEYILPFLNLDDALRNNYHNIEHLFDAANDKLIELTSNTVFSNHLLLYMAYEHHPNNDVIEFLIKRHPNFIIPANHIYTLIDQNKIEVLLQLLTYESAQNYEKDIVNRIIETTFATENISLVIQVIKLWESKVSAYFFQLLINRNLREIQKNFIKQNSLKLIKLMTHFSNDELYALAGLSIRSLDDFDKCLLESIFNDKEIEERVLALFERHNDIKSLAKIKENFYFGRDVIKIPSLFVRFFFDKNDVKTCSSKDKNIILSSILDHIKRFPESVYLEDYYDFISENHFRFDDVSLFQFLIKKKLEILHQNFPVLDKDDTTLLENHFFILSNIFNVNIDPSIEGKYDNTSVMKFVSEWNKLIDFCIRFYNDAKRFDSFKMLFILPGQLLDDKKKQMFNRTKEIIHTVLPASQSKSVRAYRHGSSSSLLFSATLMRDPAQSARLIEHAKDSDYDEIIDCRDENLRKIYDNLIDYLRIKERNSEIGTYQIYPQNPSEVQDTIVLRFEDHDVSFVRKKDDKYYYNQDVKIKSNGKVYLSEHMSLDDYSAMTSNIIFFPFLKGIDSRDYLNRLFSLDANESKLAVKDLGFILKKWIKFTHLGFTLDKKNDEFLNAIFSNINAANIILGFFKGHYILKGGMKPKEAFLYFEGLKKIIVKQNGVDINLYDLYEKIPQLQGSFSIIRPICQLYNPLFAIEQLSNSNDTMPIEHWIQFLAHLNEVLYKYPCTYEDLDLIGKIMSNPKIIKNLYNYLLDSEYSFKNLLSVSDSLYNVSNKVGLYLTLTDALLRCDLTTKRFQNWYQYIIELFKAEETIYEDEVIGVANLFWCYDTRKTIFIQLINQYLTNKTSVDYHSNLELLRSNLNLIGNKTQININIYQEFIRFKDRIQASISYPLVRAYQQQNKHDRKIPDRTQTLHSEGFNPKSSTPNFGN